MPGTMTGLRRQTPPLVIARTVLLVASALLGVGCFVPVLTADEDAGQRDAGGFDGGVDGGGDAGRVDGPDGGAACTPGADQTCNDDPPFSSFEGHCEANGTCTCATGRALNTRTGRCYLPSPPCTAPGEVSPCRDPFGAAVLGLCTLDDTCFCVGGAMFDPGTKRCVLAEPECSLGTNPSCNDNPVVSSVLGTCVVMASGQGCQCVTGYETTQATGKCAPAGVDGGVTAYRLLNLPTGAARLQLQREDVAAGHCALLTLDGTNPVTPPPGNVRVTTQGGAPNWALASVQYALVPCAHANDAATTRFPAGYAGGSITISNGTATSTADVEVVALFAASASGASPPAALRFSARMVSY